MNKRLALLVCFLTVLGIRIQAQEQYAFGFYLGANAYGMNITNSLYYDDSEPFTIYDNETNVVKEVKYLEIKDASVSANIGAVVGGFFEYRFNDYLGVQFDMMFNQTGYYIKGNVDQISITDTTNYNYKGTLKASNLNIGVTAKVHLINDHLTLDAGILPSICYKLTKESQRGIDKSTVTYENSEYNAFGCSALFGFTVFFYDVMYAGLHYNLGFTNLLKTKTPYYNSETDAISYNYANTKSTSSSLQLTIGVRIK